MSSVGATLAGGPNTTVSFCMEKLSDASGFLFLTCDGVLGYFRCVVRWVGCGLCNRASLHLLYSAIPEEWHDWPEHSEMVG